MISDFGFEMRNRAISNFPISRFPNVSYGFPNFAWSARIFSSIVCAGAWTAGRMTGLGLETGVVFSRTGRGALATAFFACNAFVTCGTGGFFFAGRGFGGRWGFGISAFIDKLIRFIFASTPITLTLTMSPTFTASRAS
jgi:hypothetical protein